MEGLGHEEPVKGIFVEVGQPVQGKGCRFADGQGIDTVGQALAGLR